jgi:actin-related protein 2
VKNGVIRDMDAMKELWDYVLCQRLPRLLGSSAGVVAGAAVGLGGAGTKDTADTVDGGLAWLDDRSLFLTESPNLSMKQRCEVMELFFEEYRFEAIQSAPQSVLSLFANGAESGVVVECGEGVTHCAPVFDGVVLSAAQRRVDLGGRAVTDYLAQLLCEHQRGANERASANRGSSARSFGQTAWSSAAGVGRGNEGDDYIFRQLKERYCYVAVNQHVDRRLARDTNALQRTCVLPDGMRLQLGVERFAASEVLFDPSLMDVESAGISTVLWECTEAADVDVRWALYENIVLSGGSTLLPGFGARLATDMRSSYLTEKLKGDASRMARCPIQVKEPPRREYMTFMGAALVAELSVDQPGMWMSRQEFNEGGTSAIVARYSTAA